VLLIHVIINKSSAIQDSFLGKPNEATVYLN